MSIVNHIFTVDVEEYYHAENIAGSLPQDKINYLPDRLSVGLSKVIDLLEKTHNQATFFVLGCVVEKNKDLIRRISDLGHEVASHGFYHTQLYKHTPQTFEEDLKNSLKILSDITGQKIIGYRAADFSLTQNSPWFFETLEKYGIVYDSSTALSLFRKNPTLKQIPVNSAIKEFAVSPCAIGPFRIPLGGGYFRAYPYWLTRYGLNNAAKAGSPLFYIHPWELDSGQPRLNLPPLNYLRHCLNLNTAEEKLKKLLSETKFVSIKDFLK